MKRTKAEAEITRESILKAALSVFSLKGYASTTLEDIAVEAGVTRGAIYWHFDGKAALYNALMNQYASQAGKIIQAASEQGGSLVEILRRVFIQLLIAIETDPSLRSIMEISLFKTERNPELFEGEKQRLANTQALLDGISMVMQQGMASGELRKDLPAESLARAFLAFQNGLIYLWLANPTAFSLGKAAPLMAEIYLHGILA